MRSLSFALPLAVAGCSLIDAATGNDGYVAGNIRDTSAVPLAAVIGELDDQPGVDVVVLAEDGGIIVCFNSNNNGQLVAMPTNSERGYTVIATADLDGDGRTEILAASPGRLDVLHGAATATTFDKHALPTLAGATPLRLTTGKVSGSANASVVISYTDSTEVRVIADPLGAPTFTSVTANMPPQDLVVGDVNSNETGDEIVVSNGLDISTFAGPTLAKVDLSIGDGQAKRLAIGEFGISLDVADVAWLHERPGPGEIGLFFGSPAGLEDENARFGSQTVGDDFTSGDFNGDGKLDLAVMFTDNSGRRTIRRFLHSAVEDHTFSTDELHVDGGLPRTFATGDLNGDGKADFLLVPGNGGGVDLLLSQ